MATQGFQMAYVQTHNWGKSVAFWQALGFTLEFETGHHSGVLLAPNGSRIFLAEQSIEEPVGLELYLEVTDAQACEPPSPVEVVRKFAATHWGTQVMTVRDPDGRLFRLEAPQ
jgi:hypothetical protein